MPDPDPSDFRGVEPVNRIVVFTEFGLFEPRGFPSDDSEAGARGRVVNLDQPEGLKEIVPAVRREIPTEFDSPFPPGAYYHGVYELVKREIDGGSTEEEIRAWTLPNMDNIGGLIDPVREILEAIEDALANRPMRYKNPFDA